MKTMMTVLTMCVIGFAASAEVPVADTSLEDQVEVAVTAYNNGLALVRDIRELTLPTGTLHLRFGDVAEQIRPETVSLRSLDAAGSVGILEQNYEYDLMSPSKLMEKYVGKPVKLINFSKEIGFEEVDAELLSVNQGPIYKVGDEIYLGHPGTVVLPEIPANLIAKPSLIWMLENTQREQRLEATYLTNGVGWRADYVVTLDRDESMMDLAGWVTLDNQSGATYTDAKLKLVAGEVHTAPEPMMRGDRRMEKAAALGFGGAAPMREETFAEWHLYTLPRRTTIKQNQSKQVSLLTAARIAVEKVYEYRGNVSFYSQRVPPVKEEKVAVFLTFANEEENNLGMPLPAGVMRVYQEDREGMLQFSGEDRIDHTPKDEDVRIQLGKAFDVVGERTQTDFDRIADNVFEAAFEIKIRNHKEDDITVDIIEPMPADWTILENSHEFEKRDAHTAVFSVPGPKDGETVVTYRVRVKY